MVREHAWMRTQSNRTWKQEGILFAIFSAFLLESCSLERNERAAQVEFAFAGRGLAAQSPLERPSSAPGRSLARGQTRSEPEWLTLPSSWSEFDCLGIQVSGDGIVNSSSAIPADRACSDSSVALSAHGLLGGLISTRTGGSISLSVPIGADRTVQLFGLMTADGTCPSAALLFASLEVREGGASHFNGAGSSALGDWPVVLASSTVDIITDESLHLTPEFLRSAPTPLFCDGTSSSPGYSLVVDSAILGGVPLPELLADPSAHPEVGEAAELEYTIFSTLKLDRRLNRALDPSDLTARADTVPDGTSYITDAVTQVDDFTYLIQSTVISGAQSGSQVEAEIHVVLDAQDLADPYGRAIPPIDFDVSAAFADHLISLGLDPEQGIELGGASGGSSLPQLGGFSLVGADLVIADGTTLYANGACPSNVTSLLVSLTDQANTKIIEPLPCPLGPNFSGYQQGYSFTVANRLADGPISVVIEGLDASGITVATDESDYWLDSTAPSVTAVGTVAAVMVSGTSMNMLTLVLTFPYPDDVAGVSIQIKDATNNAINNLVWDRVAFLAAFDPTTQQVTLNINLGTATGSVVISAFDRMENGTTLNAAVP
jgi:hypothetical protein